ncbi:Hypothetical predicted protein [Lecanosticta acicola]|uniref:Uncharacterized protein n=1 Tax=Lecanosticta acicola TaxID=111012 RepID=A0AAI8Z088_9PEZI|nr:Hypothetical predicted protein [Lecanosticta acicola]
MSLLSTNDPNIPLHCNVCPKKPDFSDVSHLLTHVASKGHLSHYFRIKVRASTDSAAQKIVDDYDEWYLEWNLDELMRERMNQKERKRGSSSGAASRRASGVTNASANNSGRNTPVSQSRGRRETRLRENMHLLDPQLGNRRRMEHMSRPDTPASNFSYDASNIQRSLMPAFPGWASNGVDFSDSPLIKQESFGSTPSDDEDNDYDFVPGRAQATRRRQYPSESVASVIDDDNVDGLANDSTKLKGVLWPGMALFDSATPEMKRKRNQKKNVSVLKYLQATSETVEPTECVFDTSGALRKEREITGNPDSEDSLIEGESEPEPDMTEKKRSRRRPRQAMAEKNVNTGRTLRARREPHHPNSARRGRGPYYEQPAEDDDDLTYGQPRSKKRTGLSIHRDNTGPEVSFDQPAPMNYLTSGFRNPLQNGMVAPQQPYQNNTVPRVHSRQPSWGQMNGNFRSAINSNPLTAQNLSQFGQYYNQTAVHPAGAPTGHHQFNVFQQPQQYGLGQQHHAGSGMFHPQTAWDMFNFDGPDWSMFGNDMGFTVDTAPTNPLFLSSTKEDDEATISAKSDG